MLKKKEVLVFRYLYNHREHYSSGKVIAKYVGVTDRTIRNYVLGISGFLDDKVANIESKPGNGYKLHIVDEELFNKMYMEAYLSSSNVPVNFSQYEGIDRQYYILNNLFLENDSIRREELIEKLHVSDATLNFDIQNIRNMLEVFGLYVIERNEILRVKGSEQNKRHFIMIYFFKDRLFDNMSFTDELSNVFQNFGIEEILIIVLEEIRNAKLNISDNVITNIVLHLALALKRIFMGQEVNVSHIHRDESSLKFQVAMSIIQRIEQNVNLTFPRQEADYLAVHLRGKLLQQDELMGSDSSKQVSLREQLVEVLETIDQAHGYHFASDHILMDGLMTHFTSMLVRLKTGSEMTNPLLDDIREKYSQIFEITKRYFKDILALQPYNLSDDEFAYFSIHLLTSFERLKHREKFKVLVVCTTGVGSAQMLKLRLENTFGNRIVVTNVVSYFEMNDYYLEGVDLIVTSISLSNLFFKVPTIQVNVLLQENDIKSIQDVLDQLAIPKRVPFNGPNTKDISTVDIEDIFTENSFHYFEEATSKEVVLQRMVESIGVQEGQEEAKQLLSQLNLREKFGTVVFAKKLAVPHPVEPVTDEAYLSVAVIPNGICWDESNQGIQLVFLLSPDKLGNYPIQKISKALTKIYEDDESLDLLVQQTEYSDFVKRLNELLRKGDKYE